MDPPGSRKLEQVPLAQQPRQPITFSPRPHVRRSSISAQPPRPIPVHLPPGASPLALFRQDYHPHHYSGPTSRAERHVSSNVRRPSVSA